ncbi:uncharacterized protein [Chaetodon trifascialis]|uniref:uncharacterized protein n=1 Tax=Chaetodon trifascialis TaxID=109706 RepID=UPI003995C471
MELAGMRVHCSSTEECEVWLSEFPNTKQLCLQSDTCSNQQLFNQQRRRQTGVVLAPPTRQTPISPGQQPASRSRATQRERGQCPEFQRNREGFPASLEKLRQLIEAKVHILQSPITEEQQASVCEENTGRGGLWRFAVLSEELTFHLQQLQRQTEQELSSIHTQLSQIEGRQQLLTTELSNLQEKKNLTEQELRRNSSLQSSNFQLCACRELQTSITERLLQSEKLVFQEEALSALHNLLTQDLQRYQEETQRLSRFTQKILKQPHRSDRKETFTSTQSDHSMQGKNETEQNNNMQPESPSEEEPSTPRPVSTSQNPKYQLFLSNELKTNGVSSRDADSPGGGGSLGENGPRMSRWETTRPGTNHFRGSLESLSSRDMEPVSDRLGVIDSPPRVFNSPYSTATSMDYNPMHRISEFKAYKCS